jgi:hypothetical protein
MAVSIGEFRLIKYSYESTGRSATQSAPGRVFADLVLIQASGETISPCGMHETPSSLGLTSSLKKFMYGHQVLQ